MSQENQTKIHLAYIETSNGPWILIFGSMFSDFSPLISLFDDLSNGKKQHCELHRESYIIPHDNIGITIKSLSGKKDLDTLEQNKTDSAFFEWCCSRETWVDCKEKITCLANASNAGHQYVFSKASCMLVVISRGEYSEDIQFLL